MKKMLLAALSLTAVAGSSSEVASLTAEYRNGQVFLQWQEKDLPKDARLSVWRSEKPIDGKNIEQAQCVADLLTPGSARDWWLDVDSFIVPQGNTRKSEEIFAGQVAQKKSGKAIPGFVIRDGGKPLDPKSGLHVHTPEKSGKFYFAVSWQKNGKPGTVTALDKPVEVKTAPISPVTISGKVLEKDSAKGKPLFVHLHGRGGGSGVDSKGNARGTHLLFIPRTLGWREGLAVKFTVKVTPRAVNLTLNDRTWLGRIMEGKEIADNRDKVMAISSFWLGYNTNIGKSNLGPDFKVDNYTEKLVIFIIKWAQSHLGTDVNRTYAVGGSMGGTGAVQLATHYPEVFAAVKASVPVYSYTWEKCGNIAPSAWRLVCSCGPFTKENPARMPDGQDLLEYASGARNIARTEIDMPPIFATNGRRDGSIPWVNNPPFFKAANDARQAITVFWNDGDHGMSKYLPADMKMEQKDLLKYRLNASFVAFSNSSDNKNYGKGDPADGDLTGWINRGLKWSRVSDSAKRYAVTVSAAHPEITYPVTTDITLRRRQNFRPAPGARLKVTIGKEERTIVMPANGVLTIPAIKLPDATPVRVTVEQL